MHGDSVGLGQSVCSAFRMGLLSSVWSHHSETSSLDVHAWLLKVIPWLGCLCSSGVLAMAERHPGLHSWQSRFILALTWRA